MNITPQLRLYHDIVKKHQENSSAALTDMGAALQRVATSLNTAIQTGKMTAGTAAVLQELHGELEDLCEQHQEAARILENIPLALERAAKKAAQAL